jgi:autotransporter-associated beta strand protein
MLPSLIRIVAVCAGLFSVAGYGNTLSWSGSGGANANWNNSANWGGAGTPGNGDTLIFQGPQPNPLNTNNIAALTLNQIRFEGASGGFDIRGNAFTLTNSIMATNTAGANTIENSITLATSDVLIVVSNGVSLTLDGNLSGSVGVTKAGLGTLSLSGSSDNLYTGSTIVNEGILQLNKSAGHSITSGSLIIGDGLGGTSADIVRYTSANGDQILNTVAITIYKSGLLDLNGQTDDVGPITMDAGQITTGAGFLQMDGDLIAYNSTNALSNPAISGHITLSATRTFTVTNADLFVSANIGGAGLNKAGQGFMYLLSSNSYSGLTLVKEGYLYLQNSWALGTTASGTVVSNGASLLMSGSIGVTNESLVLSGTGEPNYGTLDSEGGTNIWNGPITLNSDVTFSPYFPGTGLRIIGPISGSGGVKVFGSGTCWFEGSTANTYAGTTTVSSGTLVLNKSVGTTAVPGNLVVNNGATLSLANSLQTADAADVLVNSGGLFDFSSYFSYVDTLRGLGTVNFDTWGYLFVGVNDGSSTFDGLMTGPGYPGGYTLYKTGSGTFTLNGNNTYSNRTEVVGGKLVINGFQPQSPVRVYSGATLGGSGTVGDIVAAGNVSPGTSPGTLTCSNLTFIYSGTPGGYSVELTGPTPGTGYDQLNVRGTNNLANASLNLNLAFATPVALGQQFTIINNDGSDPITGIFIGYPQGSYWLQNGYKAVISYVGGTGNDVVLTLTAVPGAVGGSAVTSGDGNHGIDPNDCNNLSLVMTNQAGTPMTAINATLSTTTERVLITQPYATYPNIPANDSRTNVAPFQISTLPSFVCGTDINLQLSVDSSLGSFTTAFVQHTGEPGAPTRFDNNNVTNCPDVGTIESTNTVAAWSGGAITKVAVSLWLGAPIDSDMNLTLIAPDGTPIDLSSGNGAGANFGSGNADASRTTFDDAAGTSITAGAAPFVGFFRPEVALSTLIGTSPVGTWRLRLQDLFGSGSPDTLHAWSLFLNGTTCTSGGGACALCADGTIYTNTLDASGAVMASRLFRNGAASACGSSKPYPGTTAGSFYYHAYPFYNASSNACITVKLTSFGGDLMSSAYLGTFDPADLSINYLADPGTGTGGAGAETHSFNVPANSIFIVVVNNVFVTGGYSLSVSGGDCTPALNIAPAGSAKVDVNWPTVAGGYNLEATPSLPASVWTAVTNEPVAFGNLFNVTNSTVSPTNRFYRLHKP